MKKTIIIIFIISSFLSATAAFGQIRNGKTAAANSISAPQNTPEALLRDLYRRHEKSLKHSEKDGDAIVQGKSRVLLDKYFDKNLADLIWKDLTTHTDEIGVIDFDIFYATQDADIKNLAVGQARIEGEKATVPVTFINYKSRDTVTYELVRQNSGWKISDIKYAGNESLLKYFKEDAESNRAYKNFTGTYQVGVTTCAVRPTDAGFEIRWAKGSGAMLFFFDGKDSGKYSFSTEDKGKGKDSFVFDDEFTASGKFVRADGKESAVRKIK